MSGVLELESMLERQGVCEPLEIVDPVKYMCLFGRKGAKIRFSQVPETPKEVRRPYLID